MKTLKCIVLSSALFCFGLQYGAAQSQSDAANLYNGGIALMSTDLDGAIVKIDSCIIVCKQIGDSANDLKNKAGQFYADLHYQKAFKLYNKDKNLQASIATAKKAIAFADEYASDKVKSKTETFMVQLYAKLGSEFFKTKEYAKAVMAFDSALAINPEYISAIQNKTMAYKVLGDEPNFSKTVAILIEKLKAKNDTAQLSSINNTAIDFYSKLGSKANAANKLDEAIANLTKAETYGTDKDVCYFFADVYNKQKNYDKAIEYAQKGLALEKGNNDAKAKYYYALGVAQLGKGDKDAACGSFKSAQFGQFATAAKAQRTNNKCAD
ncbi:MAG TPA: hypothetical protein PK252_06985 [Bacteroidales bacterium]|mgnify:CR=1 FL=1|nr:hypothetical protein [Bacteroidales bacterium]